MKEKLSILKKVAKLQQICPKIIKSKKGYGYNYAPLDIIKETIDPLCEQIGIGYFQSFGENNIIKTIIFCTETGQFLESNLKIPFEKLEYSMVKKYDKTKKEYYDIHVIEGFEGMNFAQALGSLITYFRRYSLISLLGLVTEEDTDGTTKKAEPETEPETTKLLPMTEKVLQNFLNCTDLEKINRNIVMYNLSTEALNKINGHITNLTNKK